MLAKACRTGYVRQIINEKDGRGCRLFHAAVALQLSDILKKLTELEELKINARAKGVTCLHLAALTDNDENSELLDSKRRRCG